MQTTIWLLRLLMSIPVTFAGLFLVVQGPSLYLEERQKIQLYQALKARSHYVVPELDWKYTWKEKEGSPVYFLSYRYSVGNKEFRGESQTRTLPVWDRAKLYYLPDNPEISSLDPQLSYQALKAEKWSTLIAVILFSLVFIALTLRLLVKIWLPHVKPAGVNPV